MTTSMLLVRHGESTWNEVRRWQGQADPPLTERGERQALDAVPALSRHASVDIVVTSTLRRAARTGELLARELGARVLDPLDALMERAAGEWEGLTRSQIHERYPGFLDEGRRPPGYEDDADVVERAGAALSSLSATFAGSRLVVVSHGGVINALERHEGEPWVRLDNLEARWFEVTATSVRPVGERVHLLATDEPSPDLGPAYA